MSKGWKKIESKIVHENPYYIIREDKVKTPKDTDGKYFYLDKINSVVIIAENEKGELSLVGQTRYPIGNVYSWEFIMGGVKAGEDLLKAAKRELEEEAGFRAKEWTKIGTFYPINGHSSEKTFVYLARDLTMEVANHEDTEDITHKEISLEEILEMVKNGTITCGMTLAALQQYLLFTEKL